MPPTVTLTEAIWPLRGRRIWTVTERRELHASAADGGASGWGQTLSASWTFQKPLAHVGVIDPRRTGSKAGWANAASGFWPLAVFGGETK